MESSQAPEHEQFYEEIRRLTLRKGVTWPSESDRPVTAARLTKRQLAYYARDTDATTERILRNVHSNPETPDNLRRVLNLFVNVEPVISIQGRERNSSRSLLVLKRFGDAYVGFRTTLIQT